MTSQTPTIDLTTYRGGYVFQASIDGDEGSILSLHFVGKDTAMEVLKILRRDYGLPLAFMRETKAGPA